LIVVGTLGVVIALTLVALRVCLRPADIGPRDTDISLDTAETFRTFPLYWLGPDFHGYKLDRIIGQYPGNEDDPLLFVYGTCGKTFDTGCRPPIVVKTIRGCLRAVDDGLKIRERTAHRGAHLQVQAGDVVVTVYADSPQIETEVADQMKPVNPGIPLGAPMVQPGAPLPGSLCELSLIHPRPTRAPVSPEPVRSENRLAATVISSLGNGEVASSPDQAAAKLGWKVIRTNDARYTSTLAGAITTFKNTLPALSQTHYAIIGRKYSIDVAQEPESYQAFDVTPYSATETIGPWTGKLWSYRAEMGFEFFSGESINGQRIRVSVFSDRDAVSLDDIRQFVRTLTLED